MNVLIACEESQTVCKAFRAKEHNAFSCDVQEHSGGHPEWHIQGTVLSILNPERVDEEFRGGEDDDGGHIAFQTMDGSPHWIRGKWDLIIAHPPCTYMSIAGACRMYPTKGHIDPERYEKALEARDFFMKFYNADCNRICIENPMPMKCIGLPLETQRIQPYMFGEPWSKKTYLWLKGLPPLVPTNELTEYKPFVPSGTNRKLGGNSYGARIPHDGKSRSNTFKGIAEAMAEQWG